MTDENTPDILLGLRKQGDIHPASIPFKSPYDKQHLARLAQEERFKEAIKVDDCFTTRFDTLADWLDEAKIQMFRSVAVSQYALELGMALAHSGHIKQEEVSAFGEWMTPIVIEEVTKRGLVVQPNDDGEPTIYLPQDLK